VSVSAAAPHPEMLTDAMAIAAVITIGFRRTIH
jgi:hypothetical protein